LKPFFSDNHDDDDSQQLLEELENIDDDCDKHGIQFVKIDESNIAEEYGIENVTYAIFNKIYHNDSKGVCRAVFSVTTCV
jgi:hypothetical protein